MKSVHLQLLVTLLAAAAVVLIVAARDLPPTLMLWNALRRGECRQVRRALNWGANVQARNERKGATLLHEAAEFGYRELVEMLIARGADVNARDVEGRTPLHVATSRGFWDVMEVLLTAGADVDAQDREGRTPLHLAVSAYRHHPGGVYLLLAWNADLSAKDDGGATPLRRAIKQGDRGVAELLRRHGAWD